MIFAYNDIFKIDTLSTSLIFKMENNDLKQIYYGKKVKNGNFDIISNNYPNDIYANNYTISSFGRYDYREQLVSLVNTDGTFTSYFEFTGFRIFDGKEDIIGLPSSYGCFKTIEFTFIDKRNNVKLIQRFSCFSDTDVIATSISILNENNESIDLKRCMSLQLDLNGTDYTMHTFDGYWARERFKHSTPINAGIHFIDSKCGASSSYHNPFVLYEKVKREKCFIATNLIYSGNHKEIAEATTFSKTRILSGINDFGFDWILNKNERFDTPEAIFCYGEDINKVTEAMHSFVSNHIIRGKYKNAPRPVVYNNWEATYFDSSEEQIIELAKIASSIGVETFVLDDGWFGKRKSEKESLGDWHDNLEKYPDGLNKLASKINDLGMQFGIWMEPEMISEDSDIYRAHPEYAMKIPNANVWIQREQLMLDLTNKDVQKYVIDQVNSVLKRTNAKFLKWDFNRLMTDVYTKECKIFGEYFHKYILSLYRIIKEIVESNPDVLFESCASGGARFDLGLMCYMPQVWTSDNTEAKDRVYIQESSLYALPQSVMSCHVSICPNHQNGKYTSIDNRFNVACAGLLGYEYDLTKCTKEELECIKKQIAFYKEYRDLIQYGKYIRLDSFYDGNYSGFMKVSQDKDIAIATVIVKEYMIEDSTYTFYFSGLDEDKEYLVKIYGEDKEYRANGDILNRLGLNFGNIFTSIDKMYNSIATKMFIIKRID